MKRMLTTLTAGLAMLGGSMAYAGEATAVSVATNGGRASATATSVGNANSTAIAGATNGGRAVANSNAVGTRNGFADSRSVATADHGLAISNSNADARGVRGGRAFADSESIAATMGGVAISNSDAIARGTWFGTADSRSRSAAISDHGEAISDSRAVSDGLFGGRATSVSDAYSDAYRGRSVSRVRAVSGAEHYGVAEANGIGVNVTTARRGFEPVNVHAESHASRSGLSQSRATLIRIERGEPVRIAPEPIRYR
jgi:hypothetical protein